MTDVTITMPEDVARSVLQAVADDPDRSKWGHHQHNRTIAQQALALALSDSATEDTGGWRAAYADIPQTMRDLLDEVYKPDGVVRWWNSPNRLLDGLRPSGLWTTVEGRKRVREVVESLGPGQVAT